MLMLICQAIFYMKQLYFLFCVCYQEYFYLMPHLAFQDDSTMDQLLFLLTVDSHKYSLSAMKIFITLSAYKPLGKKIVLLLF